MQQRSAEWLEARKGRITGSRVGAILGLSPYATRNDVMREMVRDYFGAEKEFTGNAATEYGTDREEAARADFMLSTGAEVQEVGLLVHPVYEWLAASPDGLIGEDSGIEIKCPYSGKLKPLAEQPHYEAQIQLCMEITNRDSWVYYAWTDGKDHMEIVSRDKEWFSLVLPNLQAFMAEFEAIVADEAKAAPYLAPLEKDLSDDEQWRQAAKAYLELKASADAINKELDHVKKELIRLAEQCGTKKAIGCGVQAIRTERQGSINYKAVPALKGVDLEQYRGKPSSHWTIR